MQRKLTACPFCGSQRALLMPRKRCVVCEDCEAEGPIGDNIDQAVRRWNERKANQPNLLAG